MGEFAPLARALNQLERSYGGDGNGVYSADTGAIVRGVDLTTAEIAYDTFAVDALHVFHTRYATAGGARSSLNHPFTAGAYALAHNGHWSGYKRYAPHGAVTSDTETAAGLVARHGLGILLDPAFNGSGVWIAGHECGAYVINRSGRKKSFYFHTLRGGGYFHASEDVSAHLPVVSSRATRCDIVYKINGETGAFSTTDDIQPATLPATSPPAAREYRQSDDGGFFGIRATRWHDLTDDDDLDDLDDDLENIVGFSWDAIRDYYGYDDGDDLE
jgi:hypothetical protein